MGKEKEAETHRSVSKIIFVLNKVLSEIILNQKLWYESAVFRNKDLIILCISGHLVTWWFQLGACELGFPWNIDVIYVVQFSSVTQSCPTLCDPMNHSTPGLPVHHQLPEFTQTHDHWVGDAIQPSHPLSSPSPPVPKSSQHQGLFQWVNSSHKVAKVLEFQLQHQSFQWTPRTDL